MYNEQKNEEFQVHVRKKGFTEYNIFTKTKAIFLPGLTNLIGANGYGKTTLLRIIYDYCIKEQISCLFFENISEIKPKDIIKKTEQLIKIQNFLKGKIIILIDNSDANLSIDQIQKFKKDLSEIIKKYNNNLYIITASNTYEMCIENHNMDTEKLRYIKAFPTYLKFSKYITKTAQEITQKQNFYEQQKRLDKLAEKY